MNPLLKAGTAGALALAGVAAHASIPPPSGGNSDAILFAEVVNAAGTQAVASYAGDTGVSISTLAAGGYSNTVLGSDTNLAKLFQADNTAAGDTIQFAVLGGQYTGNATTLNFKTPGTSTWLTTTTANTTSALSGDNTGSLVKFAGLNGDISTINSNAGGALTIEGSNPATTGVWDVTNLNGTAYWDGGATSNANPIGGADSLYVVTAGTPAGTNTPVKYSVVETVSLSQGGLTFVGSPVPLPAAVWLLGSGLLGLTGVARRKMKV